MRLRNEVQIFAQIRTPTESSRGVISPQQLAADAWSRFGPDPCVAYYRSPSFAEQQAQAAWLERNIADDRALCFAKILASAASAIDKLKTLRAHAIHVLECEPRHESRSTDGVYTTITIVGDGKRASYSIKNDELNLAENMIATFEN